MSINAVVNLAAAICPELTIKIRNQTVRDPTQVEIFERSAEVRKTWNQTRWQKEHQRFRSRRWTVPEVRIAPSLLETC
jgi:hypothetical protein